MIRLNATKFVSLSVLTLKGTIYPKKYSKPRLKSAISPLPVEANRSKTWLLKLPIDFSNTLIPVHALT